MHFSDVITRRTDSTLTTHTLRDTTVTLARPGAITSVWLKGSPSLERRLLAKKVFHFHRAASVKISRPGKTGTCSSYGCEFVTVLAKVSTPGRLSWSSFDGQFAEVLCTWNIEGTNHEYPCPWRLPVKKMPLVVRCIDRTDIKKRESQNCIQ